MERTGDLRVTQFLIQKVSIDVQHNNVASMIATTPPSSDWAEFISLATFVINFWCGLQMMT